MHPMHRGSCMHYGFGVSSDITDLMGGTARRWLCCGCCSCGARGAMYVIGLVSLGLGVLVFVLGFFSNAWVFREGGGTLTADAVENYGLWTACSPESFGSVCQHIFDAMPEIEHAARGSQALLTLSVIFYVLCLALELASRCRPLSLKAKLAVIFDNHIIEFVIGVASVVGFLGMLVFAAEVKNKASRSLGQEDLTGRGFGGSLVGQILIVIGCCLMGSGREASKPSTGEVRLS